MRNTYFITTILAFCFSACSSEPTIVRTKDRTEKRPAQVRQEPTPQKTIVPKASPERIFEAGKKFFDNRDFNKSFDYFMAASNMWKGTPKEGEAQVWALRSLVRGNRYNESLDLSSKLLKAHPWTDSIAIEIAGYKIKSLESVGDNIGLLNTYLEFSNNIQFGKERELFRQKALDVISSKLSPEELNQLAGNSDFSPVHAAIYFRLGEMSYESHDQDSARKFYSKTISVGSGTEWAVRAQEILNQLESVRRVEPKTIGVVLPMTGKHAQVATKTLRGVQMGLGLYNNYPSSFKLAVVDSEGNPDSARRGVERLIKDDNVISIIGSVLSKTAPAVAAKSSEMGVPSIALSQKSGVTELGPSVFRNSLTSEMQVRYLVKTAMEELGMKRFAIMYPNDLYGVEYTNIFWDEVLARGGQIVGAQSYSNKETDFRDPVQRLVGTYYLEGRSDEYKLRLKEWTDAQTKRSARNEPPEDLLPAVVNFDGIFIPDGIKAMGQISAMLSFNGVKGVHLLGTNLWNAPGLAKRAGHFSNSLLFVDSFVGTEQHFASSQFVKDYRTIFNEEPGIFEIQGYDAALLLRQLISQGNTSRESLTSALSKIKDFPGTVGPMSMTESREIMRPVVALTLDQTTNVVPYVKPRGP